MAGRARPQALREIAEEDAIFADYAADKPLQQATAARLRAQGKHPDRCVHVDEGGGVAVGDWIQHSIARQAASSSGSVLLAGHRSKRFSTRGAISAAKPVRGGATLCVDAAAAGRRAVPSSTAPCHLLLIAACCPLLLPAH